MLYIGEQVGRTGADRDDVPRVDIAVDPLEGTNLVAHGQAGADHGPRRVRGGRPDPRPGHLPREAVRRTRSRPARSTSARAPTENLRRHRPGARPPVSDITVVILERQRHDALIAEVREAGARIKLIGDGDLSAAISCAVSGTGVHAVMGIGGAPEGVITAAALRCLGGEIQARFRYRSDDERERGARMGHGDEYARLQDRGPGPRREPRLRGDRRDRRRPPPGRPLLRRRRADAFAGHGLPGEAGPLRRHRPHVRPRQPAARPALATPGAFRLQGLGRAVPAPPPARPGGRGRASAASTPSGPATTSSRGGTPAATRRTPSSGSARRPRPPSG